MAFTPEPIATPTGIGVIIITLKDMSATDEDPAIQEAAFDIKVVKSDGKITTRRGDLAPHITPAERTALMDFMDTLRARAVAQILPTP